MKTTIPTLKAGRQLKETIKLCYRANRPVLLHGRHGVGKSELLEQAAGELGINYLCRDLSLMEPPDLIGMPKIADGTTRFVPPAFLPTRGKGLLVFEELNRCDRYMRAPCLQLLTARTLNDYTLPDGWLPVAAINPPDSDYDVHELDAALLSRFVQLHVIADREEWLVWARDAGLHKDVLGYVEGDARIFDDTNPRAWHYVSDLMRTAEEVESAKDILEFTIAGLVGPQRAVAFRTWRKHGFSPPPVAELLRHYAKHRPKMRDWLAQGQTDVLGDLAFQIQLALQARAKYTAVRGRPDQWKALGDLLADLPADLADQVRDFMRQRNYEVPLVAPGRQTPGLSGSRPANPNRRKR
jgi:hypothetical protein